MFTNAVRCASPDLASVLRRFPMALAACAAHAAYAVAVEPQYRSLLGYDGTGSVRLALGFLALASVAAQLWSEFLGGRLRWPLQCVAAAAAAGVWLGFGTEWLSGPFALIAVAALLLAAPAPLRDDGASFAFATRAVLLFFFAVAATSLVLLGIGALEMTAEYLLAVKFPAGSFERLATVCVWFVARPTGARCWPWTRDPRPDGQVRTCHLPCVGAFISIIRRLSIFLPKLRCNSGRPSRHRRSDLVRS